MKIVQSFLTNNPCYKAGRKIAVKGLMLHSVGCAQPSAQVFINTFNKSSYSAACVHAFIDGNTGTVYQTLPLNHRGWHGGRGTKGCCNDTHIGVEMCEPKEISYTTGGRFTCSDTVSAKACVKRTYDSAVELFAYLCKQYGLNPLTDICSHKEGCAKGIATNHGDPEHLWVGLGTGFTMDGFRKDVKNMMNGIENIEEDLTMNQYNELKQEIAGVKAAVDKINGKMIYNYVDRNLPDSAKPTIRKMIQKGYLQGSENGKLNLTDEMLRIFVINDRAGVYGE